MFLNPNKKVKGKKVKKLNKKTNQKEKDVIAHLIISKK